MKVLFARENRPMLLGGVALIALSTCSFALNQIQHSDARQHSDFRWNDLGARFSRVESACKLKEGP